MIKREEREVIPRDLKEVFILKRAFCTVLLVYLGLSLLGVGQVEKAGPIPMQPLGSEICFSVASERPGSVYSLNMLTGAVSTLYTRPSGHLYSFAFHPGVPEKLYLVDANDKKIFLVLWLQDHWSDEEVVYQHTTYIKDIAFGPEPITGTPASGGSPLRLFFSEATGAGGGKIYYLDNSNHPVLYYHVRVPWAGNFAFDEDGVLYLSSGNRMPAKLYKVQGGVMHILYQHTEPLKGFVVRDGRVYFANWRGSICRLDLASGHVEEIFRNPKIKWLSDVEFHR